MFSMIRSGSLFGVDGRSISVEVDICSGLPQVNIVGLPDPAVRESIERVRAALKNSGYRFPMERITVNLAPADLRKEGTAFDLAIAVGILTASGQLDGGLLQDMLIIGELGLDGRVRPVSGVLAMVEHAKMSGVRRVMLPEGNGDEAAWISGMQLYTVSHLDDLKKRDGKGSGGLAAWTPPVSSSFAAPAAISSTVASPKGLLEQADYADIAGQQQAKRAMMIAAAGKHNIVLCGPPGTGKTMLARRLPGILPPLGEQEALEVTKIYSAAGKLPEHAGGLISVPPFRAPHHTISTGGMIGGGTIPKPGEATLAHRGVLFLDELPEFPRIVLELLRQPLEDRIVTIARAKASVQFPASFMLVASYNPCPCGYYGFEQGDVHCSCTSAAIARYRSRLSGPLLDRIDLQLDIARPALQDRTQEAGGLSSSAMRELVAAARERQLRRNRRFGVQTNCELSGAALREAALLQPDAAALMDSAFEALSISMRAYDRLLKLALTIADLAQSDRIEAEHVAEAVSYRRSDR